jgi:hypothetical protein
MGPKIEVSKRSKSRRKPTQLIDQTLKLPSYASCLRAEIKPRNFNALKEYYEIMVKDSAMAKVNERKMFH